MNAAADDLLDEELRLEEEIAVESARRNFEAFVRYINPTHSISWHHRLICRELQRLADGDITRLIVTCPPRVGKACADDEPILTSRGWTQHGGLHVGDEVLHPTGAWVKVLAVGSTCFVDRCVHFSNGATVVVHANHEWTLKVTQRRTVKHKTICTQSLSDMLDMDDEFKFKLPAVQRTANVSGTSNVVKVTHVSRVSPRAGRCIQVAAPDGLYLVGKQMTPTHNSELISRHYPAWLLGVNPNESIIATSYGSSLAHRMSRDVQRVIDSPPYKKVFPDTRLYGKNIRTVAQGSYLRNSDIFEVVNHRGVYRAAGLGGGISGMGGGFLFVDDNIKDAASAMSKTILDNQWEWYSSAFRTRLAKGGRIAIVATRWSHDDIIGRLIALGESNPDADQWRVVKLPAINELGPTEDDPRQPGDALWPEFFPKKDMDAVRATNSRQFEALYQCNPVPLAGNLVNDAWWREYEPAQLPQRFEKVIISADLTFKGSTHGDWTVFCVMGLHQGQAYVLDVVRRQVPFTGQLELLLALHAKTHERWGVREVIVEDAANGAAMVNVIRSRIPHVIGMPTGRASKEARVQAVTPIIEAGNVHLPCPTKAAWVQTFRTEWAQFPTGAHDDIVDATSQALARLFPVKHSPFRVAPIGLQRGSIPSYLPG